jgi:hypothetical protein
MRRKFSLLSVGAALEYKKDAAKSEQTKTRNKTRPRTQAFFFTVIR